MELALELIELRYQEHCARMELETPVRRRWNGLSVTHPADAYTDGPRRLCVSEHRSHIQAEEIAFVVHRIVL